MSSETTYVFDEGTLVLEGVTLAQVVELVIEVLVDLAGSAVFDEETAEDSEAAHPDDLAIRRLPSANVFHHQFHQFPIILDPRNAYRSVLRLGVVCGGGYIIPRHTSILSTLPLTEAPMSANSSSGRQLTRTGARVHGDGLADDEAIGDELADRLAGVGVGDLVNFVGVQPDLALAAADYGRREALLRAEVDPVEALLSALVARGLCGLLRNHGG